MAKTITARPNQSMLDIVLMEYGTLQAAMEVMAENDTSISAVPDAGSEWIMPVVDDAALDKQAAGYLKQNKIEIGTLSA